MTDRLARDYFEDKLRHADKVEQAAREASDEIPRDAKALKMKQLGYTWGYRQALQDVAREVFGWPDGSERESE